MTENKKPAGLLNTGDKVGRYEVQSVLGSGGESTVYKGYDAMLDRHVAIKQVAPQYAGDADFVENLQRNIRVLVKLAQRNDSIIDVHEMVQDERGLFVVMEYVEGPTLQQVLSDSGVNGPLEPKAALVIIFRLAAGLNEMHSDGMIHRDIKPSNIVMAEGVKPRIIDYGVATVAGSDASMPLVTMKYLAPELHNLDGEVDGRSDIYSLGFMMYELLLGEEQFNRVFADVVSDTHQATMRWMKWHGNPGVTAPLLHELNPDIPVGLSTIVDKMISKDPNERYASAEELGGAIKGTFKKGRKGKAGPAMVAHPVGQAPAATRGMSEEGLDTNMAPLGGGVAAAPGVFDAGPETAPLPKGPMSKNTKIALIAIAAVLVVGFCGLLIHRSQLRKERDRVWASSAQGLYDAARDAYKAQEYATAAEKDADLIKKYPQAPLSKRAQIYLPMSEAHLAAQVGDWEKAHGLVTDARERAESLEADAKSESEQAKFAQDRLDDIEKLRSKVYSYHTCTKAIETARKDLNRPPDNLIQFDQIIRALDTTLGRGDVNLTEAQAGTVQTVKTQVKRGKFLFELNELEQEGDRNVQKRKYEEGIQAYDQAIEMFGGKDPSAKLVLAAAREEIQKRIGEKVGKARVGHGLQIAINEIDKAGRGKANPDKVAKAIQKLLDDPVLMKEVSPRQRKRLERRLKQAKCNHFLARARKCENMDKNFIAAKEYYEKALGVDPRNQEAKQALKQMASKTKRAALVKAGDAAYAKRDYAAARELYVKAAGVQADAHTAGQIRECEYNIKLNEGHTLLKAEKYDLAKTAYLQAKTIQPAHTAEVDALITAIDTERAYRTKIEAGDAALKKKSFSAALSQYKMAQKIKDTPEIAKKIKLCQYSKHLTHGKEAVEAKNWALAKWNLQQAIGFNKTKEAEDLLAGVLKKMEEEN
jgi:tRNA A-37 threonylcarbamoyl transferase component Bud32/tetratricopeptide (TPR) repeat protein